MEDKIIVDETGCDVDDLVYCGAVQVTVPPGMPWSRFVERAVDSGWVGVEALASLSGSVGEVVARNGARFGYSAGDVVGSVRTWDRLRDAQRTFPAVDCHFEDGDSRLSTSVADGSGRYEPLDVTFLLRQGDLCAPVSDEDLAGRLGIAMGGRAPLDAVLRVTGGPKDQESVTR